MRHQNSVFHQLTKQVPWSVFDGAVSRHGSDRRVRRLRTRDQFLALLYGQFSGAASLREIEYGLASQAARLYHAGLRGVSRSTPFGRQREAAFRGLRRCLRRDGASGAARAAAQAARRGAPARCDQGQPVGVERDLGAVLCGPLRGQAPRRLRPAWRGAAARRSHARQGQRHHPGQSHADRAGRDLCL